MTIQNRNNLDIRGGVLSWMNIEFRVNVNAIYELLASEGHRISDYCDMDWETEELEEEFWSEYNYRIQGFDEIHIIGGSLDMDKHAQDLVDLWDSSMEDYHYAEYDNENGKNAIIRLRTVEDDN